MGSGRGVVRLVGKVKPRADEGAGCSPGTCAGRGFVTGSKRKQAISWKDFIRSHMEVLVGTDFFTVEVLTLKGRVASPHCWGPAL
jgi:putative transposase